MNRKFSKKEKHPLAARYHNGESATDICTETSIAKSMFYTWLKPYKTTYTDALQKVNCTVSSPLKEKLREFSLLYGQYSVHVLCEALEVSRGTFYNHIFRNKGENNNYQIRRTQLSERIKQIYEESNQIFGSQKIKAILANQGESVSDKMVAELIQEMNLYSIRTGAKKNFTRLNYEKKKIH